MYNEVYAKRKGIWEFEAKNLFVELNKLLKRFIKNTPGNGKFLYSVLYACI